MHIFLTGDKHIGKSTLVSAVLEKLDFRIGGLLSVSSVENGVRSIYLRSLDGSVEPIACGVCENHHITMRCPDAFNSAGRAVLLKAAQETDVVVIDEIGNMERNAREYSQCIENLLSRPFPLIFGVLQDMADSDLANRIRTSDNIRMYRVDASNRDDFVNVISAEITGILKGLSVAGHDPGRSGGTI